VDVSALRRFIALTGAVGALSIGLASTPAGLVATATASGGLGGCEGGGGPTSGPTQVLASHAGDLAAAVSFTSVSGTTETDISIDAFQSTIALAGSGAASDSIVFVGITVTDTSTGIQSVGAFGCTETPDFQVDQTLTSATLGPTSVTLVDPITNTSSAATVSAEWTGAGDVFRTTQVSHFHSGNFTETFNFTGFSRQADATGTVVDSDLGVSIDGPATYAEIDKVNVGVVSVCVGGC
jgi:hypothetical protein